MCEKVFTHILSTICETFAVSFIFISFVCVFVCVCVTVWLKWHTGDAVVVFYVSMKKKKSLPSKLTECGIFVYFIFLVNCECRSTTLR